MDSIIFNEFARIMAEKNIIKTSDKKDTDYNIIPDKVNADSATEETGYDLVEIAHPDQVQVSNSRLNDGIVENNVERQKIMVDVAKRNPRGIISEIMQLLVKASNVLDSDLTLESSTMSKEVDNLLISLAQQHKSPAELGDPEAIEAVRDSQKIKRLEYAVNEALELFILLEPSAPLSYENKVITNTVEVLRSFSGAPSPDAARKLAQYVDVQSKVVIAAIKTFKRNWYSAYNTMPLGDVSEKTLESWNVLKEVIDTDWVKSLPSKVVPINQSPKSPELDSPGIASKAPVPPVVTSPELSGDGSPSHKYYVSHKVKELQALLDVAQDGKLGPKTFGAIMEEATKNYNLKNFLQSSPTYTKGYQNWDEPAVENAIAEIKKFRQTKSDKKNIGPLINPYPESGKDESPILNPYDDDYKKQVSNAEDIAQAQLVGKYPNVEVFNGLIYPDGMNNNPGERAFPFNQQSMRYLLRTKK